MQQVCAWVLLKPRKLPSAHTFITDIFHIVIYAQPPSSYPVFKKRNSCPLNFPESSTFVFICTSDHFAGGEKKFFFSGNRNRVFIKFHIEKKSFNSIIQLLKSQTSECNFSTLFLFLSDLIRLKGWFNQ